MRTKKYSRSQGLQCEASLCSHEPSWAGQQPNRGGCRNLASDVEWMSVLGRQQPKKGGTQNGQKSETRKDGLTIDMFLKKILTEQWLTSYKDFFKPKFPRPPELEQTGGRAESDADEGANLSVGGRQGLPEDTVVIMLPQAFSLNLFRLEVSNHYKLCSSIQRSTFSVCGTRMHLHCMYLMSGHFFFLKTVMNLRPFLYQWHLIIKDK